MIYFFLNFLVLFFEYYIIHYLNLYLMNSYNSFKKHQTIHFHTLFFDMQLKLIFL